jgi:CheY-like chemotaxis protein
MPVMDGEELIRKVKNTPRLKDIPFIIYTSASQIIDIESLKKKLGARDCILKPIEFNNLVKKLKEILV